MPEQPAAAPMAEEHWTAVRTIYQAGIDTGHATFESAPPATWEAWHRHHINDMSLVAIEGAPGTVELKPADFAAPRKNSWAPSWSV